jgi:hypothetical protein
MECDKMTAAHVIGRSAETKGNFHRLTNDVTLTYQFACLWYLNWLKRDVFRNYDAV